MSWIKKSPIYIFLSLVSFASIFPFFWMIVSATNTSADVQRGRLTPGSNFFVNLTNLLDRVDLLNALLNSIKITAITMVLLLCITSIAGYGFEIYRSKGKDRLFSILLLSMMIPGAALIVPLFRMFANVNSFAPWMGLDTPFAVILPSISGAFMIFFFRQSAKMFPRELVEAGRIDGLSEIGIFFRIFIPTMKTTYAAATIIAFMGSWNSYMFPLIMLHSPERQTLPLLVATIGEGNVPDFGLIMLAVVIITLPVAIVFFALQKYFVAGMMGSVK